MLTVYSKSNCPECLKTFDFLEGLGLDYEVVKVDEDLEARLFLVSAGHRAVPQIYYEGAHVGGYSKVVSLGVDGIMQIIG